MVVTRSANKQSRKQPATPTTSSGPAQRRVKNKVGSPAGRASRNLQAKAAAYTARKALEVDLDEYETDEFVYSESEDLPPPSPAPSQQDSDRKAEAAKRQRLPYNLQRSLLADINARGGISKFDERKKDDPKSLELRKLLNERPLLYGELGDKLRERLCKKVVQWRQTYKSDPVKWSETLRNLNLKEPTRAPSEIQSDSYGVQDSGDDDDFDKKPEANKNKLPVSKWETKPASKETERSTDKAVKPSTARKMNKENSFTVFVNLKKPEANWPFLIYDVPDFPAASEGKEMRAFFLVLQTDDRFSEHDQQVNWYSGFVNGSHTLRFKIPAWPFEMHPKTAYADQFYSGIVDQLHPAVKKSIHSAHSVFDVTDGEEAFDTAETEARKWMCVTVDFSAVEGIGELSSRAVFAKAGDKDDLDFELIDVPVIDVNSGENVAEKTWLGFKVGCVDPEGVGGRKVQRSAIQLSALERKKLEKKQKQEAARRGAPKTTGENSSARAKAVPDNAPSSAKTEPTPFVNPSSAGSSLFSSLQAAASVPGRLLGGMVCSDSSIDSRKAVGDDEGDVSSDSSFIASLDHLQKEHTDVQKEGESLMDTATAGENKRTRDEANTKAKSEGLKNYRKVADEEKDMMDML